MLTALLTLLSVANGPIVGPIKGGYSTDPCALKAAEASATLGPDVDFRELKSNGIEYYNDGACLHFVGDFVVPSDANPASEYGVLDFDLTAGWATAPTDEQSCENGGYNLTVYRKAAGAKGFTKRSETGYHGVWSNSGFSSGCTFVKGWGPTPASGKPSATNTEVWRVVVGAATSFQMQPVRAKIAFRQIPK